jgi:hypothetical protein
MDCDLELDIRYSVGANQFRKRPGYTALIVALHVGVK